MCVNYLPPSRQMVLDFFHADPPAEDWKSEAWKDYAMPIILPDGQGGRRTELANYSLVPRNKIPPGVRPFDTMNARIETIGQLRHYKGPWHRAQLCLVPCTGFFEPCYETKAAVRWQIGMADSSPFAVAGMWHTWDEPDGGIRYSFTQVTINADQHPLMKRFHKPGDEKRSLVIVPVDDYDEWLYCRAPEIARTFCRLYPAEQMRSWPDPLPSRAAKSSKTKGDDATLSLF